MYAIKDNFYVEIAVKFVYDERTDDENEKMIQYNERRI